MDTDVEFEEERSQGASEMVTPARGRGADTSPRWGWGSVTCGARWTTLGGLSWWLELRRASRLGTQMWGTLEETRCLKP